MLKSGLAQANLVAERPGRGLRLRIHPVPDRPALHEDGRERAPLLMRLGRRDEAQADLARAMRCFEAVGATVELNEAGKAD